ncbi:MULTISPECIES: hypothetical protein [unclassified Nocardioides]|uniref:hypothetical protein n=1 Tax=unclassified Nocardioides TaxID=2615069 RepID=UPI00301548E8
MLTRAAVLLLLVLAYLSGPVTGASAQDPGTAPSYDELPVGAPTTLPWWQAGRLHVGDTVLRTRRSDIVSRGGTTLVATGEEDRLGRDTRWFLVQGSRLRKLPMHTRAQQPLVSADGRWIAWREVRAPRTDAYERFERYRVVLYDVRRHRVANRFRDRRLVEWEDGGNGIWLRTLSNRGRLVLSRGSDGVQVLSPRGRPVRFRGPQVGNGVEPDGWPGGTTVYRSRSETSVYGEVRRNGRFTRVGRTTAPFSGLWSTRGSGYAYEVDGYDADGDRTSSYRVRPLRGATVRLRVPADDHGFRVVGWETDEDLVLWSFDDGSEAPASRLVRCSATSGACERVTGGPRDDAPATMSSRY